MTWQTRLIILSISFLVGWNIGSCYLHVHAQDGVRLTYSAERDPPIRVEFADSFVEGCTRWIEDADPTYRPIHCQFLRPEERHYLDTFEWIKPTGGTWSIQAILYTEDGGALPSNILEGIVY